jgi:hypothetical protein
MDSQANRLVRPWVRVLLGVALACMVLGSTTSRADELSLLINGKAIHIDPPPEADWNEKNWGFGLHYDFALLNDKWLPFLTASGFKDSNDNPQYYAGGGMMRRFPAGASSRDLHFDAGVVGFVMYREDFKDNKPFLGALPAASIGAGPMALNITYVPRVDPKMVPIIFLQLKITLAEF